MPQFHQYKVDQRLPAPGMPWHDGVAKITAYDEPEARMLAQAQFPGREVFVIHKADCYYCAAARVAAAH